MSTLLTTVDVDLRCVISSCETDDGVVELENARQIVEHGEQRDDSHVDLGSSEAGQSLGVVRSADVNESMNGDQNGNVDRRHVSGTC